MIAIRQLLLVLIVACCMTACDDEPFNYSEDLRQQLNAMELAFNEGQVERVIDAVADDVYSEYFSDRRQVKIFVLRQRQKHTRLTSLSSPAVIKLQFAAQNNSDLTATASFKSLLTGGRGWLPTSGQFYQFVTDWRWQEGAADEEHWELIHAQWHEVFEP